MMNGTVPAVVMGSVSIPACQTIMICSHCKTLNVARIQKLLWITVVMAQVLANPYVERTMATSLASVRVVFSGDQTRKNSTANHNANV